MDVYQIITLSLVQGITEFLPISSSAHLILVPYLTSWQDQGLGFDIAVHLGTLFAVLFYYREYVGKMTTSWFVSIIKQKTDDNAKLAWFVLLGTLPVGFAGLLLSDFIRESLRDVLIIAITSISFGVLLWYADFVKSSHKNIYDMSLKEVLLIGVAQAVALIPGTSRSGITITAALLLGFSLKSAARFSFLLSIPVIVLSSLLLAKDMIVSNTNINYLSFALGFLISAFFAFMTIFLFLKFIEKTSMLPFVIYRIVLGTGLLLLAL
jgi:undecaprenyl-diphosphatase